MLNNRKRRPSHPGAILVDILPDSGLTQTDLARLTGVSRRTINEIINERRQVSVDMAHRLSCVFGTTPELWLNLQRDVDIWDSMQAHKDEYERIRQAAKAA
ncbi:MAG TPA: HigA family addiction module antitoxin [Pyrinomonadaceae bacterium]|nr:HigA family addiction module antitoxin [Pyrinomonadaceae bacterium]